MQGAELLFQFLVVHAALDYMLQPDVMASAKCRRSRFHREGNENFPAWYYWLGAHSLCHGGGVYLVSGSLWMGLIETALHGLIDHLKCEHKTTLAQDQALHFACKLGYLFFLI